jgi:hypothetical protein
LMEETGVPEENKSLTNCITKCCIEYTSPWMGFELTTLVVISTDCTGSCKKERILCLDVEQFCINIQYTYNLYKLGDLIVALTPS